MPLLWPLFEKCLHRHLNRDALEHKGRCTTVLPDYSFVPPTSHSHNSEPGHSVDKSLGWPTALRLDGQLPTTNSIIQSYPRDPCSRSGTRKHYWPFMESEVASSGRHGALSHCWWKKPLDTIYRYIGMCRISTFRSTTDCIYDGGPIIIKYHCVKMPTVFSRVTRCTGL